MATANPTDPARWPIRRDGPAAPPRKTLWQRMAARWRMPPETLDDYDARQW